MFLFYIFLLQSFYSLFSHFFRVQSLWTGLVSEQLLQQLSFYIPRMSIDFFGLDISTKNTTFKVLDNPHCIYEVLHKLKRKPSRISLSIINCFSDRKSPFCHGLPDSEFDDNFYHNENINALLDTPVFQELMKLSINRQYYQNILTVNVHLWMFKDVDEKNLTKFLCRLRKIILNRKKKIEINVVLFYSDLEKFSKILLNGEVYELIVIPDDDFARENIDWGKQITEKVNPLLHSKLIFHYSILISAKQDLSIPFPFIQLNELKDQIDYLKTQKNFIGFSVYNLNTATKFHSTKGIFYSQLKSLLQRH